MREILNLSLPTLLKNEVELAVKKGGYASKSEFIRELLRLWREERLLNELRKSRKQISSGRGRILKSLKDLR